MRRWLAAIVAAGAWAIAAQAYAHHSFPESYEEDRTVTVQGELSQILLRNPHSIVQVVVKEKNGSLVHYAVEWVGACSVSVSSIRTDARESHLAFDRDRRGTHGISDGHAQLRS